MRPDAILQMLERAGFEARYVGGCVRDTLLGRPVHDWDIASQALPEDVLRSHLRREFPQAQEEDITAAIDRSGGFLGQAMSLLSGGGELPQQTRDFVQAFSARDALGLMQTLTPMEKWKRDALADTLEYFRPCWQEYCACSNP